MPSIATPSHAKPTDFSAARIQEAVQQLLAGGELPAIVQAGHPVLRQIAAPYDGQLSDAELSQFIDLLRRVMHKAPGVGLAAPQLGVPLQLAVLEDQYDVDPAVATVRGRDPLPFFAMLNPGYQPQGGSTAAFYEGCLSLAGLQAAVTRPAQVLLDFTAPDGSPQQREFRGWQARIVQHETDHLHGILYLDRSELRSLTTNAEYSARWAHPDISLARQELGFLPGR
ncbi:MULTISPECIES: peptide deformylase [unclassified Arthrobacter]|uniref:peptide deformylase n=1 Tax=unclassified Arthrobacter TaxID=235627 RepID=UPI002E0A37C6|nr:MULTISPECIES: peptide deformylase [unclassified Arthrobacter]MEC5191342.1 peptide deformylase [Arthrobacter sp. MP_M4]MEC5202907.1 peptide deformylase [Arthrobacter sp. MP_M7]